VNEKAGLQPTDGAMTDNGRIVVPVTHPLTTNHVSGPISWAAQIRVTPAPPSPITWSAWSQGEWHTLLGEPTGPWCNSTQYTVTIPEGIRSGLGEQLQKDYTFQFSTRTV
jgi:hypothetical protein